ncbi:hypothetical protein FIN92_00910 [Prevotella brunnea]|uniref:phage/plasmid replication domain-containing protein n=1 Tax=Prevotella brunnea TaxID=2508867 RepID=UPI0028280544|nr:phage/plasmid replication protein [Prevotella brunnea]MDR0185161.1 hypothetical protein [Prevotella brunnea]
MIGYDTLHLFVGATRANQAALANVANLLQNEGVRKDTGEVWSSGSVGNLRVSVGGAGMSVKGSISAFYGENNSLLVGKQAIQEAIEKMSDTIHVKMADAKVTRLDVCANFILKNETKAYLDILGSLTYFQRVQATHNTLYYQRGRENLQTLCFYNKEMESKETHKELPKVYSDSGNMLRYEARFNGRVAKQFRMAEVTASTLAEATFYNQVVSKWGELYFNITKIYNAISMNRIKTVSEAKDYIFAVALANMGAQDTAKILNEMKAKCVFGDRKYYSRLRTAIEDVNNKFAISDNNDLARELDDEVRTILAYK